MELSISDYRILRMLDERGGFTTRQVAHRVGGAGRKRSQWTRQDLLKLKEGGYTVEMDDRKPACWLRTAKGTEALATDKARFLLEIA